MNILGISAFYHDSAAALVQKGEILAAAQRLQIALAARLDEGRPVEQVASTVGVHATSVYRSPAEMTRTRLA